MLHKVEKSLLRFKEDPILPLLSGLNSRKCKKEKIINLFKQKSCLALLTSKYWFFFLILHIYLKVLNCKLTVQCANVKYCNEYRAIAVHIIGKVREPFFHNSALSGTGPYWTGKTEIKYKHSWQISFYSCQRLIQVQDGNPWTYQTGLGSSIWKVFKNSMVFKAKCLFLMYRQHTAD